MATGTDKLIVEQNNNSLGSFAVCKGQLHDDGRVLI